MRSHPLRPFFRLAFGITWGVGALGLLFGWAGWSGAMTIGSPLVFIAGYGPSIAGLVCTAWFEGWPGVRQLLAAAVPQKQSLVWYPAVLIGYPAVGLFFCQLLSVEPTIDIPWRTLGVLLGVTLLLDTGPLGEEFGWRGFALQRLLTSWRPITAGMTIGVAWAVWHVPTFFIPSLPQSQLSLPLFLVSTVSLSIAMTGLYVRTGGRLDLMILVHLVGNFWASLLPFTTVVATNVVFAIMVVAGGRMLSLPEPTADVQAVPMWRNRLPRDV